MISMQTDIESRVISAVTKCTGIPLDKFEPSYWQEPLTGSTFNLFAVDLIYILFEIEQELNIQIPPEALEQYSFSSVSGICSAIRQVLKQNT